MKFLRVGVLGEEKPAVIDDSGIIRNISTLVKDFNPNTLNLELTKEIRKIDLTKLPALSKSERIGACISKPEKFIGIGLNYSDHAKESNANAPKEPIVFFKANSSICGPNDNINLPKGSLKTDWEIELGVIIGKKAKNISKDESMEHIFGFCIVNDISEREYQLERSNGQWDKGKAFDTFGPIGPYIVTKEEIKDVQNLNLQLKLNNETMQHGNSKNMIFGVAHIISYLTFFMTLKPGDIITTGTPPGVGMGRKPQKFLKAGDEMILEVDGLGRQKQKVVLDK